MAHKSLDKLGKLQRAVMEIVWERGQASVHQVRDRLGRRKRPAYTTVLSVMQKLEKTGWLRHRTAGRTYIYHPARTRAQAGANSLRQLLEGAFHGNAILLFEHLIEDEQLRDDDLARLREMIDQKRKELRHD